jgi:broad specificity phosphatase PhoE
MLRYVFIRHSTRNLEQKMDCGITEEGVLLVENNMKDVDNFITNLRYIISSPYRRTLETSFCVAKHFDDKLCDNKKTKIVIDNTFREILLNECQKLSMTEPLKNKLSGVDGEYESFEEMSERLKIYFSNLQNELPEEHDSEPEEYIYVTHGGVINIILEIIDPEYVFDKNAKDPSKYKPHYSDFIVVDISKTSIEVIYKNF